jgi:pimeloyl-ACP methyl ester carboxylesterase
MAAAMKEIASRRSFFRLGAGAALAAAVARVPRLSAQPPAGREARVRTPALEIGYEDSGDPAGFPIVLLHGFPDDVRAWDEVIPALVAARYRALVPYLRGYGPTRFLDPEAPRMAQQAAIGQDLIDFADALGLQRFAVAGYDWGGRAACIAAVLHPERVRAAVLIGGYTIQNTTAPSRPGPPAREAALWYQWYFNTERGRAGLAANRHALCRLLWTQWSPTWRFTDQTYDRTAASFDNPDFVEVVIHSYRHRHANAAGEPRFEEVERALSRRPAVTVPTAVLYGSDDGGAPPGSDSPAERSLFAARVSRLIVAGAGHFLPRENPAVVSAAILDVLSRS